MVPCGFQDNDQPLNMAHRTEGLNKPCVPKDSSSLWGVSGAQAETKGKTPGGAGRAQKASTLGEMMQGREERIAPIPAHYPRIVFTPES